MKLIALTLIVAANASFLMQDQDPCAGCDTALAQAYQTCAMKHGNPCAETNEAGLVTSGPGTKKDVGCCMKKEKHDRCLECSGMDCAHGTCNVNWKGKSVADPVLSQLGKWISKQRSEYRKFQAGKKSQITQERIDALAELEFDWAPGNVIVDWSVRLEQLKRVPHSEDQVI